MNYPSAGNRLRSKRLLEPTFALLASTFVASLPLLPYPGDFLLKVSPIACLVAAVAMAGKGLQKRLLIAALVFSGIGDIALELGLFAFGLAAFLLAHLFYLSVFCHKLRLTPTGFAALLGLALYALLLQRYLSPFLSEMAAPVYLYMGVIFTMAAAAISGRDNHPLVALGAVLFVVSDSLIAINRFVEPLPGARHAIMLLYYGAQYLLTHDARRSSYPSNSGR